MGQAQQLLVEGLSDAAGFVGGALLGGGLAHLLGWELMAEGYGGATLAAIVLVSIGGGVGLQLARRWRMRRNAERTPD